MNPTKASTPAGMATNTHSFFFPGPRSAMRRVQTRRQSGWAIRGGGEGVVVFMGNAR